MVSVHMYVRKKLRYNANVNGQENKIRATADTMCENDENLLAVAWWVILNSLDLFFLQRKVFSFPESFVEEISLH